jgi:hypothetical protein
LSNSFSFPEEDEDEDEDEDSSSLFAHSGVTPARYRVTFVFVAGAPSRVILVERSTAFRSAQAGLFVPFLPLGRIFVLRKRRIWSDMRDVLYACSYLLRGRF